ncbi:MAG: hypothetical protein HP490_09170 [Nitrospira sp.]|nr:hypothetical protein [Nitrospira sp.]MBH0186374.1 hypothetical protein [Nitrospira sp.]
MAVDRETGSDELERLTVSARDAAAQGRWDLVEECYRLREAVMQGVSIAPQDAERMLASDRQVQERALVAQAAVAALLRESQTVRLRLSRLRQRAGATGTINVAV